MIKVYTINGIDNTRGILVAYEIDGEIIICDMGADEVKARDYKYDLKSKSEATFISQEVFGDISQIPEEKVKAIVLSNANYNCCGAFEILAKNFSAQIFCTDYTFKIIKKTQDISSFEKRIKVIRQNSPYKLLNTNGLEVELINVTFITPQSSLIAIHTPDFGIILHAVAFKFDNRPALGFRPNYKKLSEFKEAGISLLVCDAQNSNTTKKTLSEILVKEVLRDIFIETDIIKSEGILMALDCENIARIKSVIGLSLEASKKVLIIGDLKKYMEVAKEVNFLENIKSDDIIITNSKEEIETYLKKANEKKEDYVVLCSGVQGEPWEILSQIVFDKTPYKIGKYDNVVFSSKAIQEDPCKTWRLEIKKKLNESKCKINEIEVSKYAGASDIKDLILLTSPKKIIPVQGDLFVKEGFIELAEKLGFVEGKNLLISQNKDIIKINL